MPPGPIPCSGEGRGPPIQAILLTRNNPSLHSRRGNQVARGFRQPGRDAQLFPFRATAPCDPACLFAAHPGPGSLGRHRPGGSLSYPTRLTPAGKHCMPGPGKSWWRCGRRNLDAFKPRQRAGRDRVRRAPTLAFTFFPHWLDGVARRPSGRSGRALIALNVRRRAALTGGCDPLDRLPPRVAAAAAQSRSLPRCQRWAMRSWGPTPTRPTPTASS